jgi:hypothetical protein
MFEKDLYTYLLANIADVTIFWGKIDPNYEYVTDNVTVNYFSVNNSTARLTPSYLYNIQISVRSKYIDKAQEKANEIVQLFHLYNGDIGSYKVWVSDVITNSALYEEEDLVQIPIILSVKITGL